MTTDFDISARAAMPPTAAEVVEAIIGLSLWTGVYCAARLVGGCAALAVWGTKAVALSIWRIGR